MPFHRKKGTSKYRDSSPNTRLGLGLGLDIQKSTRLGLRLGFVFASSAVSNSKSGLENLESGKSILECPNQRDINSIINLAQ